MVNQLLSAQDLKTQVDTNQPMMSTNTGDKPGYISSGLPVNKGLPKAPVKPVSIPNAQPIGAIAGVNAPSPIQQAVSTAQANPSMQKDFTNAFSPKAAPTTQQESIPVVHSPEQVDKGLTDLTDQMTAGIQAGKTINIDKLKTAYPEFSHVDNSVLQELTDQISQGIAAGKTVNMDKLKQAYPELTQGSQQEQPQGFVDRLKNNFKGVAESIGNAGEGGVALLDKLLGTEDLANSQKYAEEQYGMSPYTLKQKDPEKYQQYLQELQQGAADKYKTTASQDVLNVAEGTLTAAQTAAAPGLMAAFTTAGSTEFGGKALEKVSQVLGGVGSIINYTPGLSTFRDSLPPEDQKRFDSFVGNVAASLLLGTKNKMNIVKDPKTFIAENVGSQQIIDNFKQNVIGLGNVVKENTAALGEGSKKLATYGAAQVFGLTPDTIKTLVNDPKTFDAVKNGAIDTEKLLTQLGDKIDEKANSIGELGKEYQTIRDSNATANTEGLIDEVKPTLDAQQINVGKDGNLEFGDFSKFNAPQQRALNSAWDIMKKVDGIKSISADSALNIRNKIDDLVNWEGRSVKSSSVDMAAENLIKQFRRAIDARAKEIPGLKELDAKYGPEVVELRNIKKDFFNRDGTLKDNALSKLSNLTKKGNEARLERVKQLIPDIEPQINAIKALEDVKLANGQKVGSYVRTAVGVFGAGSVLGPLGSVLGLILTSPSVATMLLTNLGYAKEFVSGVTKKIDNGTPLTQSEISILEQGAKSLDNSQVQDATSTTNSNTTNSSMKIGGQQPELKVGPKGLQPSKGLPIK